MTAAAPKAVRRQDYRPPAYRVDSVHLEFELYEDRAEVTAHLALRRAEDAAPDTALELDGVGLELLEVTLDSRRLGSEDYRLQPGALTIPEVPAQFELSTRVRLAPQENTSLQGLYRSGGLFCTQCEAQGFRHITFYPDRPDVMAPFTTTVSADRTRYPVLLANGNPVASGDAADGRHWVRWEDPFPKPSYLFALVAGDLACLEDRHRTGSGRDIALHIYTEPRNRDATGHAMQALKAAMAWDEATYGLKCDLDCYMIVAVDDFNMGAMENKGLNIFNSRYILATPDTATDRDYDNVEAVVGHEYFHNWTGNRVTLRDWFQLSLKEGLTVFREQQFSAERGGAAVHRIDQVRGLRTAQFPEDAGPMAHPVRPDSYLEINNFYTATVYVKGAEVIRMLHTLLGRETFIRGVQLYLERNDGRAVTCEALLEALEEVSGRDLSQFALWYAQAGTPRLTASHRYLPDTGQLQLTLRQHTPPTPGQARKVALHVPVRLALIGADGARLPLQLAGEATPAASPSRVLELTDAEARFEFTGLTQAPVPSLLQDFSAPVKLAHDLDADQLAFLFAHDCDPFNRWDAGQTLACRLLLDRAGGVTGPLPASFLEGFRAILETALEADRALAAEALTLPGETYLGEQMEPVDVDGIHQAREGLRRELGHSEADAWGRIYRQLAPRGAYRPDAEAAADRRLRHLALGYLVAADPAAHLETALHQYQTADNLSDRLAALTLLADLEDPRAEEALADFHRRWRHEPLLLDKWFSVQARSRRPDTLERVRGLAEHPDFQPRNPNRLRALIGAFAEGNPAAFHRPDGQGYTLLAEHVIRLDRVNPQVAARLALPLSRWRGHMPRRRELMREQLRRIFGRGDLSKDLFEVVSKSLADTEPAQ